MKLLKKYYIYIIELIIGNIIFNFIYATIKTLIFINIGATNETLIENIKMSFSETLILYIIFYIMAVIVQILYDKYIVYKLNNKLIKQMKEGDVNEE